MSVSPRPLRIVLLILALANGVRAQENEGPGGETPILDIEREHWAFRPLNRPAVPTSTEPCIRNPIDAFIWSRLNQEGLEPMPSADRLTLLRRATFDLTGLPPTPEAVARFLADDSPNAYESLIDRLLESPAYGERWAQHWLDLARYAETDGFEHDNPRPAAWKYRDWVIHALNADMGYDEFLRRQIAGDELYPDQEPAHIATGFLLCGPDMPDLNLEEERRHMVLNEIASTIGSVVLGLQFGCAQCHNHKFDPISQADFYRLRAFFANVDLFGKKQYGRVAYEPNAVAPPSYLMIRGDFQRPGDELSPCFPRIVNPSNLPVPAPPANAKTTQRRTALANWLTQADHPLTTRVIVNRLWHYHFGKGLVASTSDFGFLADEPTYVDLLDWLATELPRRGWSFKQMHRLIMTSSTYRAISRPASDAEISERWKALADADPANDLFGRRTPLRLEGEAVRDAMLACAGQLSGVTGGPGVMAPLPAEVLNTIRKDHWKTESDPKQQYRRSIYLFVRRNLIYPMFAVFDKPDTIAPCSRRNQSTTAPQALTLFNSELALQLAQAMAADLRRQCVTDEDAIRVCHLRSLAREPEPNELKTAMEFLQKIQNLEPGEGGVDPLAQYCLAVFNLNEFIYVD